MPVLQSHRGLRRLTASITHGPRDLANNAGKIREQMLLTPFKAMQGVLARNPPWFQSTCLAVTQQAHAHANGKPTVSVNSKHAKPGALLPTTRCGTTS